MKKQFLIYIVLLFGFIAQAQSKAELEQYITKTLSYQHIKTKYLEREFQISIHQIEFNDCTMSYGVFKKSKNKIERFTVRINLRGISKIEMTKNVAGYSILNFTGKGKSILREYPDGNLVHERTQFIPLKVENQKALDCFKKLQYYCMDYVEKKEKDEMEARKAMIKKRDDLP
ncbi:MAG: hypothetical protein ABI554_10430, partial [Flavobacterium sp.]